MTIRDEQMNEKQTDNSTVPTPEENRFAYHLIKNTETGEENWVKDPTSMAISYTNDDLKTWVHKELIPKNLGVVALRQIEKHLKMANEFSGLSVEEKLKKLTSLQPNLTEMKEDVDLLRFLLENKERLVTLLKEIPKKRRKTIRQSGQFVDQKLKYESPDPKNHQPTLFDRLSPETIEQIENAKIEIKASGIRLTPSQDKLVNAIYKLLADNSETHDIQSEFFYGGNVQGQIVPYGGNGQTARATYLKIKPAELYKEYLGEENYSGKEIENVKTTLKELVEKKFLIVYERKRKVKVSSRTETRTETRTDRLELFQSLIHVISFLEDLTDTEVKKLDGRNGEEIREKKGELIIALNPVVTDQITSKYVEYPSDINKRTVIAAGGHRHVTESIIALRDYMLRELSAKRYKPEMNADKLPYMLKLENCVKSNRKKRIKQRIDDAIVAVRSLGLIQDVEITNGAEGQKKYIFTLNKNFE